MRSRTAPEPSRSVFRPARSRVESPCSVTRDLAVGRLLTGVRTQRRRARSLVRTVRFEAILHDFPGIFVIISPACVAKMRRTMMDGVPMLAIISALLLVTSSGGAQSAPPVNDRANPYALVRNWPQLPEGRTLGAVSGVDVDRDG